MRAGLPYEPEAVRQHTRGPSKPAQPAEGTRCRPAVYALGLYVDRAAVQQRVAPKFQGQAPDSLARSQQLLDGARPCPAEHPSSGLRRVSLGWRPSSIARRPTRWRAASSCWAVRAPARPQTLL